MRTRSWKQVFVLVEKNQNSCHCFFLPNRPRLCFSCISAGAASPDCLQAFFLPTFLPFLTSRLDAQQQHKPICTIHPRSVQADAIHMNVNIWIPIVGTILTVSSAPCTTFLKIRNMTVAITVATVVNRAVTKANIAIGNVAHRVKIENGLRNMETKQQQAPVMKRPNIQWLTTRTSFNASMMVDGRAIEAPERSSEMMIETGCDSISKSVLLVTCAFLRSQ